MKLCLVTPLLLLAFALPVQAASPSDASDKAAVKTNAKPAKRPTGKAAAPAEPVETPEQVSTVQLDLSMRVLTGTADCEFKQQVEVMPWTEHPGHFRVSFAKKRYLMVPLETATGAIRLEDRANGVVWLQIPSKSMLMDAKHGQRLVDGCTHSEQRAALEAVRAAGNADDQSSLGITQAPETNVKR